MKILQYIRLHVKNSITQIVHYNTVLFLKYAHSRYAKCLLTNTQKQLNYFLRKIQTLRVNNSRILRNQNARLSGHYFYMNTKMWRDFQICISVPLTDFFLMKLSIAYVLIYFLFNFHIFFSWQEFRYSSYRPPHTYVTFAKRNYFSENSK